MKRQLKQGKKLEILVVKDGAIDFGKDAPGRDVICPDVKRMIVELKVTEHCS
jgi:hypothetical protein